MRYHKRLTVLLAALTIVGAACGSSGGGGPTAPEGGVAQIEFGSFELVNEERDLNSVRPPLGADPELSRIAREYSEQMRDGKFFGHTSPAGETLRDRLQAAGYSFSVAGENLARVTNAPNPAGYAHQLLMGNPSHRGNILNDSYRRLGVGVASQGSTVWITQVYVQP